MNIRPITMFDVNKIKLVHEEHFAKEFDFPDLRRFYSLFVVEDDNEGIITAGGIRPITEAIAFTDMSRSARERRDALIRLFQMLLYSNTEFGFDELHCFIQNETWMKHLIKMGFRPTIGKSLVIG